jgi:hypothetical protein
LCKEQSSDHAKSERTAGIGTGAKANGDGECTDDGASARHHNRAKANRTGLEGGFGSRVIARTSNSSAKSTIMMAFFFTMPMSIIKPTNP